MTVQPTTRPTVTAPLIVGVLLAGLALGFVAGQAAPELTIFASRVAPDPAVDALTQQDDYGIRILLADAGRAATPLSADDDWALRHFGSGALGPSDDYGTRHRPSSGE
jgi:hypothetical protein